MKRRKDINSPAKYFAMLAIALFCYSESYCQIIDNLSNGANGMVRSYFIDSISNELFIGGRFNVMGGTNCNQIAKLSNTGWQSIGSNEEFKNPGIVFSIAKYNNELYIGGKFDSIGNQAIHNIARFDGTTWHQVGQGLDDQVLALKVYNDTLYAGGEFDSTGSNLVGALARYNGNDWVFPGLRFNGSVFTISTYHGDLLIGGNFQSTVGNAVVNYNSNGYFADYSNLGDFVINLNTISDTLFACGSFTLPVQYLASFYNNTWNQYPVPIGGQNWVTSIIDYNNERYLSGYFGYDVAKYTSTGFSTILSVSGYVSNLFVFQNKLYMIGWYADSNLGVNNISALTDTSLEVSTISKESISIYPTPTHNEINIQFPSNFHYPINCSVRNIFGVDLIDYKISNNYFNFNIDLPTGIYFIILENSETRYSYSIIKL